MRGKSHRMLAGLKRVWVNKLRGKASFCFSQQAVELGISQLLIRQQFPRVGVSIFTGDVS